MKFVNIVCGNLEHAKFCVSNPADLRLGLMETNGAAQLGVKSKEFDFPMWLVQIRRSVTCWSRVRWYLPCCVCSGINPRVKSGRFMKILPDYEHMEYRDVYTCRTYLLLVDASRTEHTRDAAWSVTWLEANYFGVDLGTVRRVLVLSVEQ